MLENEEGWVRPLEMGRRLSGVSLWLQHERYTEKEKAEELMNMLDTQWKDIRGHMTQPVRPQHSLSVPCFFYCTLPTNHPTHKQKAKTKTKKTT